MTAAELLAALRTHANCFRHVRAAMAYGDSGAISVAVELMDSRGRVTCSSSTVIDAAKIATADAAKIVAKLDRDARKALKATNVAIRTERAKS